MEWLNLGEHFSYRHLVYRFFSEASLPSYFFSICNIGQCHSYRVREYWMIHRGPGFLVIRHRMIWLLPLSPPPSPVSKLDRRRTGTLRKRGNLLTREGGGGGGGGQRGARKVLHKLFISLCTLCSCLKGQSLEIFLLKVYKIKYYTCRDGTALDQNFWKS